MENVKIEYSKLKFCYLTVKKFLECEGNLEIKSLETKIEKDLGFSGDDNLELLENFVKEFELDHNDFDYSKHFYSEREIFNSNNFIFSLLNLSIWLPLKTIEFLSLNNLKIKKPQIKTLPDREVLDLTFRQLIQWYVEKKYLDTIIRYEIINKTEA